MSFKMTRKQYAEMYGPTTGDSIRLADTDLIIQIEKDHTTYGEEVVFGGGKVIRDGMGQHPLVTRGDGIPDVVITNAVILDYTGIYKADIGIRDGKIAGIGKGGKSFGDGWCRYCHWSLDRNHCWRRNDCDSWRNRHPCSFY